MYWELKPEKELNFDFSNELKRTKKVLENSPSEASASEGNGC